jgi:CRISPR-associated endonuclease Csn1
MQMEEKKILGLDLGTNSIGWALIDKENHKILGMGSRIIPMGTDKQDYEKGVSITKNADRRLKRTIRKMNKRYKLRRNKLLFVLHELGMLPTQFRFKEGIPEPNRIQKLELLPIPTKTVQLDSLGLYKLRESAINSAIDLKDFGKILYQFNQLRGYAGGNNDDDTKKKKDQNEDDDEIKKYEVTTQKVTILKFEESDKTFKAKGGKNKGQEQHYYNITVLLNDNELIGSTALQDLKEKIGQEEELEIRIKRNKKGETTSIIFALPQKTNWRKQMEATEKLLMDNNLYVSQLIVNDLRQNKWTKIRNRVFLRHRYQAEFDKIWETQSKEYPPLNNCPIETLEKIAWYIFPGKQESQQKFRQAAINGGLKYIIKDQIIYYQRPLKPQTELISNCRFEKEEKVLANSHPLFQEFRCWDQINRIFITSKQEVYNEKKNKRVFRYTDRFLTNEEKQEIYNKLQIQKQISFNEIKKIVTLKDDRTEFLNGLHVKAKLKGCDTIIAIKKILGEHFDFLNIIDKGITTKIWKAIFDNAHNGSEYDPQSLKVSSIKDSLKDLNNDALTTTLALKCAQSIKFPRKYANLSEKAITNILPLMQLKPINISGRVKENFAAIQHIVTTGELLNDNLPEDYVISFVKNNPNALATGGLMYAFASSLIYGKHTNSSSKATIHNYHDITYINRNLRNPIVEQIVNETMQVIKAGWKQYQFNPDDLEIRVELARELKNSAAEREKIFKAQIRNNKANETIKEKLKEENITITDENILKYKLFQQQRFISPYSGNTMKISLFDEYEIDHIIPKSRYFDDSFSNKVLVEGFLNKEKSNMTAWEYITQQTTQYKIQSVETYLRYVNDNFFGRKKRNLLLEKIPTNTVERQIKDTQYISLAVKNELAKIVGSDNVKTSTGEVTDFLRSRWGLKKLFMEITEERFKHMELWDWNTETNQPHSNWVKKYYDQEQQKHVYEIKNWSKRYDHRHHAIDALVVALTEQSHIHRLNDLNKYLQDELLKRKDDYKIEVKDNETIVEAFFNLDTKRREEILQEIESSRYFEKPFEDLIKQAKNYLETMVVSIKSKDKLGILTDKEGKIKIDKRGNKQLKIRGALHQETLYGKTKDPATGLLRDIKTIELSKLAAKDVSSIVDRVLREVEIPLHRKKYETMKEAFTGEGLKAFNESRYQQKNPNKLKPPVYKVKVWYTQKEDEDSTLQRLYDHNDKLSVITGDNYLFIVMEKEVLNEKERLFDIASLYDSTDIATRALLEKDNNYKQRIINDKLSVIENEDKEELFKAQKKLESKIERVFGKKRDKLQNELNDLTNNNTNIRILFTLQQNDLVYLPENNDDPVLKLNNKEFQDWLLDIENKKHFCKRVYRVTKFTGKDCSFIPHNYANTISVPKDLNEEQKKALEVKYADKKIPKKELNFVEYGSYRDSSPFEAGEIFIKSQTDKKTTIKPLKIQNTCIKLKTDWLGNICLY